MEGKNNHGFNFIKSVSDFFKKLVLKFENEDNEDVEKMNAAIVEVGRTEDEKEQLQDMCDEIDSYHRRVKEYRESGMTVGKWFEKEVEKELEKADPEISSESKDEFKKFVVDQLGKDIEAQAEALDEELDQTVNIAEGGEL